MMLRLLLLLSLALGLVACRSPEPRFDRGGIAADDTERAAAREPAPTPPPTPTPTLAPTPEPALLDVSAPTDAPPPPDPRLSTPAALTDRAPDAFTVWMDTTKGPIVIDVTRAWAPNGADRFYNLVNAGYFTDVAFFRVIEGFMAQVGLHGDPALNTAWRASGIQDDPVVGSNTRGMVTFAQTSMPNSRSTQFFINFGDNSRLDGMRFAPFGRVRDMSTVDRLHAGYGEGAPSGQGPEQGRIQSEGNTYLRRDFPNLDYIRWARVVAAGTR